MLINTNDALLSKQWYLTRIGLDQVFEDYRGRGVTVGIYDNGIQSTHGDLRANYDASLEISIGGKKAAGEAGNHGTAVAGIIAAAADNGIGGVGVASEARIASVNIFSGVGSGTGLVKAVQQMSKFDVTNNSWGWTGRYQDVPTGAFGRAFQAALDSATDQGRGGLGTIIVNSAGNDWLTGRVDANTSGFSASRATITVGAVTDADSVASYVSRGASILVSAPSNGGSQGMTTTDLIGTQGYGSTDYSGAFGGTSAAAPIVSGVVALMLEANPLLGWRDVQSILALSAQHVGSEIGGPLVGKEAFGWTINGATNFNGGGMHVSNDYGFGIFIILKNRVPDVRVVDVAASRGCDAPI